MGQGLGQAPHALRHGITDKDFELARKIEDAALWRPAGGALSGTPNKFIKG